MENTNFPQDIGALLNQQPPTAERLLRRLGASGKLVGFHYAVYMLEKLTVDPSLIFLITKNLYPDTARHFHTSAACVERSTRTLIHSCWEQPDHTLLNYVAGIELQRSPSNSRFLDMLSAYLRTPSLDQRQ